MDALKHEHDNPDTSQETGGRLELGSRASESSLSWRRRDGSGLTRNRGLLRSERAAQAREGWPGTEGCSGAEG